MKKIFLPIMLCALMVLSSVLLACEPIGEHKHELFEVPQVEATCSEAGIRKHRECRICRYWFDEEGNLIDEREFIIPATGVHKFVEVPKAEATCGEAGVDAHRECEQCDKWFDADGNQIDKSSCTIPATNNHHFEDGTCTVCGAEHEHKFVDVPKVDATCGEAGVKAHKECEECDKWFNEQGEAIDKSSCTIPATGEHSFENGTCTVCGAKDPEWKEPTLPEGLVGKYYDESNRENYIEVSKDKSVNVHIDNADNTYTVTKVEDNKVTLSNNNVIEYNADTYSITYNGKTYILDTKYPAEPEEPEIELPEGMVGKYFDENDKENYIEVLEDKSVKVHIDNEDTTFTVTKVEDNKVTLSSNDVIEFNAEAGSITYNEVTYYDDEHYPAEPELKVPEQFNGTFVAQQKTYIFDGSVNVKIRNIDGTMEDWTITEVTPDKDGVSVTLNCTDKTPITLRVLTTDPNLLFSNGAGHAYKGTAADNLPEEIVGKYIKGSMSIEVREDGYLIYRPIASMSWQYLIIEYNDDNGEFTIASNTKMTCTFDKTASSITFAQQIYTKEKTEPADPSFPDLAGIKGEFYALDKTYIFDGDNVTVVNVADNAETKYTINSSENGSMVLKAVGEGADVNLYYKAEDDTLHTNSTTAANLAVRKPKIATNIPEKLYGTYVYKMNSVVTYTYVIEKVGRFVQRIEMSTMPQANQYRQYFITSYSGTGDFVASLIQSVNGKFDGYNKIAIGSFTAVNESAEAAPVVTLPEGMAGKYYDEKNQENYFEISDDGVTAHIDGEDKAYKLIKAEGNNVTLNNEQVLTYNAEEHSITWDGNKYIDFDHYDFKLPFEFPENFFGKYTNKTNYIEIRKDGTAYFKYDGRDPEGEYVIKSWDGTTLVMDQVSGNKMTNQKFIFTPADADGNMTLTYNQTNFIKAAA